MTLKADLFYRVMVLEKWMIFPCLTSLRWRHRSIDASPQHFHVPLVTPRQCAAHDFRHLWYMSMSIVQWQFLSLCCRILQLAHDISTCQHYKLYRARGMIVTPFHTPIFVQTFCLSFFGKACKTRTTAAPGIEPRTFRMLGGRSIIWAISPFTNKRYFRNI